MDIQLHPQNGGRHSDTGLPKIVPDDWRHDKISGRAGAADTGLLHLARMGLHRSHVSDDRGGLVSSARQ